MKSLTVQETLCEGPIIVDVTCSFKRIWPQSASLRMDVRLETKPDLVGDARYLPFRPGLIDVIYVDPPHLIRTSDRPFPKRERRSPGMFERYGCWKSRSQWKEFVEKTNVEFARCLKEDGLLHYKITDGCTDKGETGGATKLSELEMSNFVILKDKTVPSRTHFARGDTKVHYLTFGRRSGL